MPRKIEISHKTIVFTILLLGLLWFLYTIGDILFAIFIALLLMTILNPLVTKLTKWRVPRVLAIFITYVLIIGILAGAITSILPPLIEETGNFVENFPSFLKNPVITGLINDQTMNQLVSQFTTVPGQVLKVGVSIFSNIFAVISVMIFTFYMLLYREKLDDQLSSVFGEDKRETFDRILNGIEKSLGNWARGQLILMLVMGVITYIGLIILGIPYALPLSIFMALLEIVPTVGAIVASVPIILIGISISPVMGLATTGLVFLVHQLEGYVLAPKVMEKSAGVNPIVTLASLAIGFRIAGVVGALVSVPVVLMLQIIFKEYMRGR